MGPNPNAVYPNEAIKQVVYIKNVITRPNIIVGEYSYYDDINGAEKFEDHVTHHYEFLGDKLIIGKFCAIAKGIEFVMNGANHRMNSVFVKRKCEQKGPKKVSTFSTRFHVVSNVFPKYQMLTF